MKLFLLITFFSVLGLASIAQTLHVRGFVKSAKTKNPLAGATVTIKGQKVQTATKNNGEFDLIVSNPHVQITISFVGYLDYTVDLQKEDQNPLLIELIENPYMMKEVVVSNGYQELPKERSTGSFTKIDNQIFNQQVSTDVLSRLEAVANALEVDRKSQSPGIMVRGLSTIQGFTSPLIILDNFPYEGNVNNINPNDVESITILKDAAASSIWGARAGNGVIIITTKKGHYNQPVLVDFNANVAIGNKPDLGYAKQMATSDFIDVERLLFSKGFYDSQINLSSRPGLSPVVEILKAARAGTITASQADAQIAGLQGQDIRNDLNRYIYQSSLNQQYALNIHGGNDKIAWIASGGVDRNIGNLDDGYNRQNLRYQNSIKLIKGLELTTDLYYTQSTGTSGKLPFTGTNYGSYPYAQIADAQGSPLPVAKDYSLNYLQTAGNGKLQDWKYYPLTDALSDKTQTSIQDVLANFGLKYTILPGLSAEVKYQYEKQQNISDQQHEQSSYFTRNLINRFTQIDASGNVTYKVPLGAIYDMASSNLTNQNERAQVSYDHSWGKNSLNVIGGGEVRDAKTNSFQSREFGVDPDVLSTGNVDYNTAFPTFVSGSTAFIPNYNGLSETNIRYVSVFSNAAYTYNGKYTLSLSGRRDASNLFGVATNDKWTPLWSSGLGWKLSDEPFYKVSLLPYLKLRTTYGFSGNVDQSKSGVTIISLLANSVYTGTPVGKIIKYANPDLRWEKVGTTNIGIDFGFKDNRISGSIEYYQKSGKDLFGTAVLDYTAGIGSSVIKNVASMQGNGIDIEINSVNLKGPFKWTTNLNLNTYHDQVTAYNVASQQGSNFIGTSGLTTISGLEGKPVYAILSYKWAGLDPATGDPRGYVNGQISKDYTALTGASTQVGDLVYSGPAMPTLFGSAGNTISWKGVSLTARIIYKFGYYFRKSSINYTSLVNSGIGHSDYSSRWQKPGDENTTNIPSFVYPVSSLRDSFYAGSEINVDKGDNIRLQYLNFSYDITNKILKQLNLQHLNIYINASNLGLIWRANKDGIDPDYPSSSFPPAKIYAFGIRGNF